MFLRRKVTSLLFTTLRAQEDIGSKRTRHIGESSILDGDFLASEEISGDAALMTRMNRAFSCLWRMDGDHVAGRPGDITRHVIIAEESGLRGQISDPRIHEVIERCEDYTAAIDLALRQNGISLAVPCQDLAFSDGIELGSKFISLQ